MSELVGWLAGRYQPYTNQHAEITIHAREVCAKKVGVPLEDAVLAVGLRELPISWYNPFDYDTRRKMIIRSHPYRSVKIFKLTKKGFGSRREIINNVGKAYLFTREKSWRTLTKLIGLPVIYEERTGGAATDVRQLWYDRNPRYKQYVPIPVANLMSDQEYKIDYLIKTKNNYWKFFGKKPWKKIKVK